MIKWLSIPLLSSIMLLPLTGAEAAAPSSSLPIFIGEIYVDQELGVQATIEKGNAKVIPTSAITTYKKTPFLVSFIPSSRNSPFTGVVMLSRSLGDFDYYDYYQCEVFIVYNPKNKPAITITDPIPPCQLSKDFSQAPIYKFTLTTHRD